MTLSPPFRYVKATGNNFYFRSNASVSAHFACQGNLCECIHDVRLYNGVAVQHILCDSSCYVLTARVHYFLGAHPRGLAGQLAQRLVFFRQRYTLTRKIHHNYTVTIIFNRAAILFSGPLQKPAIKLTYFSAVYSP